jgi:hypothetical protein
MASVVDSNLEATHKRTANDAHLNRDDSSPKVRRCIEEQKVVQLLAHEKEVRDLRTSNRVSTKLYLSLAQFIHLF